MVPLLKQRNETSRKMRNESNNEFRMCMCTPISITLMQMQKLRCNTCTRQKKILTNYNNNTDHKLRFDSSEPITKNVHNQRSCSEQHLCTT